MQELLKQNPFVQELRSDPLSIGFAYGGLYPGVMHAKGQVHESHKCTYSVGRAGTYLLHVRLRNQALSLPGSPFELLVKPDKPHAQSTQLPDEALPLRGIVGDKDTAKQIQRSPATNPQPSAKQLNFFLTSVGQQPSTDPASHTSGTN